MFYEEKVIDGYLMSRSTPDGEWRQSAAPHAQAVRNLSALTDDQRQAAFAHFCMHCGCTDPRCQCWNDD